ncbi:MAG TPA: hypothetical protein VFS92_00530 [Planctomycetota bacterium]|nr:hypothetical protein [Planctomycetota bacterium]
MRLRLVLFPLAVLLVAGGLAVYAARNGPEEPPKARPTGAGPGAIPPPVKEEPFTVDNVRVEVVPVVESFPARVSAPEAIEVRTTLRNAPVEKVLVRAGETVKKGQLLVKMSGAALERALEAARKDGDAKTAALAEEGLANLEVRSPADGVVHLIDARSGEVPLVSKTRGPLPLLVLFDWTRTSFEGNAPASIAGFLGGAPELFVRVGAGKPVRAKITRRGEPAADGSVAIEAVPLEPPADLPEPGQDAWIQVLTGTKEAFVVERAAIREEGGRTVVHVVDAARRRTVRPVVVGAQAASGRVAVSGLDRFEQVAVWPASSHHPGGKS